MTELWRRTAVELSEMLGREEVTSRDVVTAHLARIDEADSKIHAFTAVFHDGALAAADRADEERRLGKVRGPLHGLPVSVKECFDIQGLPTTLGLPKWRSRRATSTASMVTALEDAGAVVLGRTNLSQTMLFAESRNPIFGQTRNPFSHDHTSGGSSGGEAAAIASGMSPLGIGTDIGGSIRSPAAFSGICGLKPTLDRLPGRGARSVLAGQEAVRSQCGPMARTVGDLVLLLRALDTQRLSALDGRVPPVAWEEPSAVDIERLRIGFYVNDGILAASRAIVRGVEWAREALAGRGCVVTPFAPPEVDKLVDLYLAALSADGGSTVLEAVGDGEADPVMLPLKRVARLPDGVRRALARGLEVAGEHRTAAMLRAMGEKPVAELWRLTDAIRAYRNKLLDAMASANIDAILCPAFATPALPHGMSKNFTLASSYAFLWNATQMPAGVVPVTRVRADEADRKSPRGMLERHAAKVDRKSFGLPVGVQVVGRPWAESTVLALMAAIEEDVQADPGFPTTPV